jgi:hypothetical protein
MRLRLSTILDFRTTKATGLAAPQLWAFVLLLHATSPGLGNDVNPEEFLKQAPPAWQQYKTFAETLSGTVRTRRTAGDKLIAYSVMECKSSGANRLAKVQGARSETLQDVSGKPFEEKVYGRNRAYSFHLRREQDGKQWVLVDLDIPRKGPKTALDAAFDNVALLKREAVCVGSYDLSDLIQLPTFRVIEITPIRANGQALVKLVFDNPHKVEVKGSQRFCPVQSGTLVLDPARDWCLRSYRVGLAGSDAESVIAAEFEYDLSAAGHPVPKRCKKSQVIQRWLYADVPDDVPKEFTTEIEYELHANRTWPDEDFTLSAFGFPEPPDVDWRPPTPWYVWAMVAALVLLTAGGVFAWLKRRAMRARSSQA